MGVRFTESDIRRALGRQRVRGSNNFVVCVLPSDPSSVIERSTVEKSNERSHAVALRVALGETDDEEVEMERIFGQHAFERGFGLEPLFSGALQTPTRGLRSASCWPWGVCLHTLRVEGEAEADCPHGPHSPYGTAGAEIARALRRASETVLALDACAVRNHVRARGEWCLIDFDPYFTKVAETAEQRAAARGFVAVQMLLLGSQMPGLFTLEDIAEETERREEERSEAKRSGEGDAKRSEEERSEEERSEEERSEEGEEAEAVEAKRSEAKRSEEGEEAVEAKRSEEAEAKRSEEGEEAEAERNYDEGPQAKRHRKSTYEPSVPTEDEDPMSAEDPREDRGVSREELARELVARIVRVAASFPDAARALACVVQMYGAYGMVGVARKPARRAMADANKPDSVEALVSAGLCETHASLFVRAALGLVGPEEFEEVYAARIAGFFRPTESSGPSGPSGPTGPGGPSGPSP